MVFSAALACAGPAFSATYVVTSPGATGTGGCDAAECTFREAVDAANANPGMDRIDFDLPGSGVRNVPQGMDFPALTGPTIVDGYSQPGSSPNTLAIGSDATLLVRIGGLTISGGATTIRGLSVAGRYPMSIVVSDTPGNVDNVIEGCWFVTTPDGGTTLDSPAGGIISDGLQNTARLRIGGASPAQRNVINSGANLLGAFHPAFDIASDDAVIVNNYIGTDKTGTRSVIAGSSWAIVRARARFGGSSPSDRNVVTSGFTLGGGSGSVVEGNYFGVRPDGATSADSGGVTLLSIDAGTDHLIRDNVLGGSGGNFGMAVVAAANSSAIGTTRITGNVLGAGADGVGPLPLSTGIVVLPGHVSGLGGVEIGGFAPAAGNVIAHITADGIVSFGTAYTRILGNRIGVDAGDGPGHVGAVGVRVLDASHNVQIGSSIDGGGNEIANADGAGIAVVAGVGVLISGNSIHSNPAIAIDLGDGNNPDGPTPNDTLDADTGANDLLNHPIVEQAFRTSSGTALEISVETAANRYGLSVEAFRSDHCGDGRGEAQEFVRAIDGLASDAAGRVELRMEFPDATPRGFYSATLIDDEGNTSEVSPCTALPAGLVFGDGFE